jgi:predicted chitinase
VGLGASRKDAGGGIFLWEILPQNATGKFESITRRINGGLNGQPERLKLCAKASSVLAAGAHAAIL